MNRRNGLWWLAVLIVAAIFTKGCGPKTITPPKTALVAGQVLQKGKPAEGVRLKFHPQFEMGEIQFAPHGETGKDGKFMLSTGANGNGAPPGDYIVTLWKPRTESDSNHSGIEVEVDELKGKYNHPARSGWKVTIVDGENFLPPFQLD